MARLLLLRTTQGMSQIFAGKSRLRRQPPFAPPLSLLSMASVLETGGHHVQVVDVMCEADPTGKICRLLACADLVLINVSPGCCEESRVLAEFVHKHRPEVPVVLQGIYCTIHAGQALVDIPTADACIRGEGEHVITRVVETMMQKDNLSQLSGVYYREKDQIKAGKQPEEIQDLDSLPFPARHLVQDYDYGVMNGVRLSRPCFTSVLTSRGCPCQCRFCATYFLNGSYRQRSLENVLQEFRELQGKYGSVMVEDDNFLVDPHRAMRIMDGLIEIGSDLEMFVAGARVDSANRELYKKMARAGVKFISFGIESGNQRILDYYQKRITIAQIRKAVDLANEMGIITWGNFIFGAPVETKEQLEETLEFSMSLPLDMAFFRPLSYQRGADLWREAVARGLLEEGTAFRYAGSGDTGGHFTADELADYCRWAFKRFYFRPRYLFREYFRSFKRRDFTVLKSLGSVL